MWNAWSAAFPHREPSASDMLGDGAEKLSLFNLAQVIVSPNPKSWLFPWRKCLVFFVQSQGCGALSTSHCPIAHVGLQASKIEFQGTGKQTVGLLSSAMDWRRSSLSFSFLSSPFKPPQCQFISLPFFFLWHNKVVNDWQNSSYNT